MSITTPDTRLHAVLGTTPDGSPVTVHADRNILIQGATGSGKNAAYEVLARQWLKTPGVHVIEVRATPRNHQGRWGWHLVVNGAVEDVTYDAVRTYLVDLAAAVSADRPPTILMIEEFRPTDHVMVEAVETLLRDGGGHNLHVVVTTFPLPVLTRPVARWCATRIYVDPRSDHTPAAEDAMERARREGHTVPPLGPGSFIVTNDICAVGTVTPVTWKENS